MYIRLKQGFAKIIKTYLNHISHLIASIHKLSICKTWSRMGSHNSPSHNDINNKWKVNVSIARMNDAHFFSGIDGNKTWDVSYVIEHLNALL